MSLSRVCSTFALSILLGSALGGCGDDSETGGGGAGGSSPQQLPPLSKAPLTTEETITPRIEPDQVGYLNPRLPEDVTRLLNEGYGDYDKTEGEASTRRTLDDAAAPEPGPNAAVLTRFVHLADIQLADDESPARVVNVDSPQGLTGGAFRPQEGHECRIVNAAVRTINRINDDTPIDFVVLGGDNTDNAQSNEVDWILGILSGSELVDCDSGVDDDPTPGPNNDPKDPFVPEGLAMPYFWVSGNHDILNQGNFPPAPKEAEYLSDYASVGTRDWSSPGGPVVLGDMPADERRIPLSGSDLLAKVHADADGHGIPSEIISSGRAMYAADLENAPIRLIVLDTAAPSGSADGLLHQSDIDDFLIPALDGAVAAGRYVIVTSHHISGQLTDGGGFGGVAQDDAVLPDALQTVLLQYPNVLMHLAGHTHHHKVGRVVSETDGSAYWEVETAALADFPNQMRTVEIWDLDNGFLGIRLVAFDYQTENDPIAEEGRRLGFLDFTSGWQSDGRGHADERNVELYVPMP
ncbi:MAG: hypothetical protein HOW73_22305 [Polyangiaceae bacterium]|nr:hypothetical protein [Polyangiaceae bacterium]